MAGTSILFTPFTLGRMRLRNRIAMAPMTREMAPDGIPNEETAAYYRRRAAGGVGLVITEGAPPEEAGSYGQSVPRFFGEKPLQGWAQVTRAVHAEGACIVAQLWHVGGWNPSLGGAADTMPADTVRISPSGQTGKGVKIGIAMTDERIADTIEAFGNAAEAACRIGFDGIEIHGAHGYLVDQFFWNATNLRSDGFGGDKTRRLQFAVELVRDLRRRTAADFPITLRVSQWKQLQYDVRLADTPHELAAWVGPLADAGIDMFHCSTRRFWDSAFADSPYTLAGWTRKLTGKPTIAVGSVTLNNDSRAEHGKTLADAAPGSIPLAERLMEQGEFDLLAIGRAMLANADWANKVRDNRTAELLPYSRDMLRTLK
jgi:2,4-dienoyl-CoA reductase-like NADH-dependent reductase (Old Yellow Enzyme family)